MSSKLFEPMRIGDMQLLHKVVMSPMTRFRSDDKHIPMDIVAEYYCQRASVPGTLLITEATAISDWGAGYANIPGIWNSDQIKQWKKVTKAVHEQGSFVFCQLWALGRVADARFSRSKGYDVIGPSAIPASKDMDEPRPLREDEIWTWVEQYAHAAKYAIEAGFDGVEIHGANGYLIDQFNQDVSNQRTDQWGGSVENRSRFVLEVSRAVTEAIGPERVGIRLSPWVVVQGMGMSDPYPQFTHIMKGLHALNLCYIHMIIGGRQGGPIARVEQREFAFETWGSDRPLILGGRFEPETAVEAVDKLHSDKNVAIAFGRYFISNPDLPFKLQRALPLRPYNTDTYYTIMAPEGYIDFELSKEFLESKV